MDRIDWKNQWEKHAPTFKDGYAHVDLQTFQGPKKTFKLAPGGGFGDLSHPTTHLMLHLMSPYLSQKTVIDMGCGSGILSLAAYFSGALRVYGIDCEKAALIHSRKNAQINHCDHSLLFDNSPPLFLKGPLVICMNMIFSEQKVAWSALKAFHSKPKIVIISGVLSSEKEHYLKTFSSKLGTLQKEQTKEGWKGFVFSSH